MKRFVLLLLLVVVFVFSAYSSYSPWALFELGCNTIFYDSTSWPTVSYGIEASLLSFSFNNWTIASPVKLESVTASLPKNGTEHSYVVIENGVVTLKNLNGRVIAEQKI